MKKWIGPFIVAALLLLATFSIGCAESAAFEEPAYKDIPRVDIEGDLTDISKTNKKKVVLTYKSQTASFTSFASIKWQGNSSVDMHYPKYNYAISLFADKSHKIDDDRQFKTWLPANQFCLKANWIDSTHARNIVSARLAASIQKQPLPTGVSGLIDGFPIHLYMNGEDMGLYTWNIPKKRWMFNMDADNPNHIVYCAEKEEGTCLFEELVTDETEDYWDLVISGGSGTERDRLNRLIAFVKDSSIEEFRENFDQYLDFDSVANYYIFSEVIANFDGISKNLILATFDGDIWYACLYDMDSVFGLFWTGRYTIIPDILYCEPYPNPPYFSNSLLWSKFEQAFGDEIYERYVELADDQLSSDSIIAAFEYFIDGVGQEMYDLDDQIWTGRSEMHPEIPSRDSRLDQISEYVIRREPYTRAWMEALRSE